ncbi:hypothetical protein BC781_10910 [Sediminitomix flava]|uniref:Uncharacterized protein n=2 Tax=Sediminitomix flava TaxID=379075 RepID=A0A315Z002_SEDFL|nr:hypothetical protein BC781_10910 [Sediminitomix flava]
MYLLTLVMLVNAFATHIIFADYQIRKEYYAEVLCINKNKIELACAGSCQLKDNLKQAQETNTDENVQESPVLDLYVERSELLSTKPQTEFNPKKHFFVYDELGFSTYEARILEPPRIA